MNTKQPNEFDLTIPTPNLQTMPRLFDLGEIQIAPRVTREIPTMIWLYALQLHVAGDWGFVDEECYWCNLKSMHNGLDIYSAYRLPSGKILWVQTIDGHRRTTVQTSGT